MPRNSATDDVLQVLQEVGEPLATGELVDELSERYAESTIRNAVSKLHNRAELEKVGHGVYTIAAPQAVGADKDSVDLLHVPEVEVGAGDEVLTEVNGGLQLPKRYIRQVYGVRPGRLCMMRVRGDSMRDTMRPGQRLMAAKWEGENLEDGGIYGLRSPHGFAVKRLRFDRQDGKAVVWIWSDNDEYADHRHWLPIEEFEDEYAVIAVALEVSQSL